MSAEFSRTVFCATAWGAAKTRAMVKALSARMCGFIEGFHSLNAISAEFSIGTESSLFTSGMFFFKHPREDGKAGNKGIHLTTLPMPHSERDGKPIICARIDRQPFCRVPSNRSDVNRFNSMRTYSAPVPRGSEAVFNLHGENGQINCRLAVDRNLVWKRPTNSGVTVPQLFHPLGRSARKLRDINLPGVDRDRREDHAAYEKQI